MATKIGTLAPLLGTRRPDNVDRLRNGVEVAHRAPKEPPAQAAVKLPPDAHLTWISADMSTESRLDTLAGGDGDYTYAVELRSVRKGYGKNTVLSGINMGVSRGFIYGLLGPSGCGKTTLLRCVVGRLAIDSGSLCVFGHPPGTRLCGVPGPRVGYMPQELALFMEMSISETLHYFGRLLEMPSKRVVERLTFLVQLLKLPNKKRLIKNLSGGQQRRVSFAAALLHEPELLILDEPTVGVDPLLRISIWEHLFMVTTQTNATVIITTHYIEEARKAHMVGLMREGRLLAEAPPNQLMSNFQLPTLEDVFLRLCYQEDELSTEQRPEAPLNASTKEDNTCEMGIYIETSSFSLRSAIADALPHPRRFNALFTKNLIKLWRNPAFVVFQFAIPVLQVVLFSLAIGGLPHHLDIAVVNKDDFLGVVYLKELDQSLITQKPMDTLEEALASVRSANAWGAIDIGEDFSRGLMSRYLEHNVSDYVLNASSIRIYLDMTNQQISLVLEAEFLVTLKVMLQDMLNFTGMNMALADSPVIFQEPVYGSAHPTFGEFMAPGVIISIAYFMAVGLTALSFVMERKEGLLDRSWVAGVSSTEVMMSHVATQSFVMFVQVGLVFVFFVVIFDVPVHGPIAVVIFLAILQGFCGMSYGLLISALCDEEIMAVMFTLGTFYPNMIVSGIIWPIEAMPTWLQHISVALPQTLPVEAMRCIMSRGWDITYRSVWLGYVVTLSWTTFMLIMSAVILRLRR